jgi:hypothetical protein
MDTWTLRGISARTRERFREAADLKGVPVGRLAEEVLTAAALDIIQLNDPDAKVLLPERPETAIANSSALELRLRQLERRIVELEQKKPSTTSGSRADSVEDLARNQLLIRLLSTARERNLHKFKNFLDLVMEAAHATQDPFVAGEMRQVVCTLGAMADAERAQSEAARRYDRPE